MNYIRHIKDLIHQKYVEEICGFGNELFNAIGDIFAGKPYIDYERFNLGCFIKSEESIARKILADLSPHAQEYISYENYDIIDDNFNQSLQVLDDVFRMSFVLDIERFESDILEIVHALLENEKTHLKFDFCENKFASDKDGYKDFKIIFFYNWYKFEVQFHTKESNLLSKKTHRIYEVFRKMEPCDDRESLKLDRNELFKGLAIPKFDENKIVEEVKKYAR